MSDTALPMVRFDNVAKRYGALTVLDGLCLDIARGEKVSIIGPSGSGKTTVLRMLMTLETINDGVIWVEGEPLTHMERGGELVPATPAHIRRIRAKIGMVFQSFNLFPHMTALQNCIEAPMTVLGMKRPEAEARFEDPETRAAVVLRPRDWAGAYSATVRNVVGEWRLACRRQGIRYHQVTTDTPYGTVLRQALAPDPRSG